MLRREQIIQLKENSINVLTSANLLRFTNINDSIINIETPFEFRAGRFDVENFGAFSYLGGDNTYTRHVKTIGRFCSIASNLRTGDVEHDPSTLSAHPLFNGGWDRQWPELKEFYEENSNYVNAEHKKWNQRCKKDFKKIKIGNNVWIGEGVFIRRGVQIGDGAIVASRAVITKDVDPYSVVGGTPAKILKYRYPKEIIRILEETPWWDYETSILDGVPFGNIEKASSILHDRIQRKLHKKLEPKIIKIHVKNGNYEILE